MTIVDQITIEADKFGNETGTRDYGTFRITSNSSLSKDFVEKIAGRYGLIGQIFTFKETEDNNKYVVNGTYDCWSD
jgi:hypothetical protein